MFFFHPTTCKRRFFAVKRIQTLSWFFIPSPFLYGIKRAVLLSLHVLLLVKSENIQPLVPVTDTPLFWDACFSLIKSNEEVIKGCRTPANNAPSTKNISDKKRSILMFYVGLRSLFSVLILLVLICLLVFAPHIHLDLLCSANILFLTLCINLFNKTTHLLCETSILKPLILFARKLNDNKNLILVSFTSASAKHSVWYITDCSPSNLTICTSNHVKTPPDRFNNPCVRKAIQATKSGLEQDAARV